MADYARELAAARGIKVIQICYRKEECVQGFQPILTAGPGEFLTYIHQAEYVISNSFHGLAMSIQFKKPFTAFTHSRSGIRIQELLKLSGLTGRLYNGDGAGIAQTLIPWDAVEENISRAAKRAEEFLCAGLGLCRPGGPSGIVLCQNKCGAVREEARFSKIRSVNAGKEGRKA